MIKAIIYDLDDLMVDSNFLHIESWEILKEYGHSLSEIPLEKQSHYIGMRVIDITEDIVKTLNIKATVKEVFEKRNKIFLDLAKNNLEMMPGLIYSLELFKNNNYKIALASSGVKEYIDMVLDKFGIRKYFDRVITGDDVKKGKPDPETYALACAKLGFNSDECVVLEDAANGVRAAKGAGCKCIAIVNTHTPIQDHSGADIILNSLEEINLEIIKEL